MNKLIRYVCQAVDHRQLSLFDSGASWAPNTLRVRDGAWAYCPMGAREGHDWHQIADRPIDGLREETESAIAAESTSRS